MDPAQLGDSDAGDTAQPGSLRGRQRRTGLAVLATPNRWTGGQDFSAATLVLSSLGEPDAGLPAEEAARLGGAACVGVAELRRIHEGDKP